MPAAIDKTGNLALIDKDKGVVQLAAYQIGHAVKQHPIQLASIYVGNGPGICLIGSQERVLGTRLAVDGSEILYGKSRIGCLAQRDGQRATRSHPSQIQRIIALVTAVDITGNDTITHDDKRIIGPVAA